MPSLFLRCRKCGEPFPSGLAVNAESALKSVQMNGLRHKCPKCGEVATYFTQDYYVPAGIDVSSDRPPDASNVGEGQQREERIKMSGYGVGARSG